MGYEIHARAVRFASGRVRKIEYRYWSTTTGRYQSSPGDRETILRVVLARGLYWQLTNHFHNSLKEVRNGQPLYADPKSVPSRQRRSTKRYIARLQRNLPLARVVVAALKVSEFWGQVGKHFEGPREDEEEAVDQFLARQIAYALWVHEVYDRRILNRARRTPADGWRRQHRVYPVPAPLGPALRRLEERANEEHGLLCNLAEVALQAIITHPTT